MVCFIIGIFSIPLLLDAASSIFLADQEKKLIDRREIIVREIDNKIRGGRTFEAIGLINAPRSTVLQVLTDYEKYPEFMPNISKIEIVEQTDNVSVLNYTLTLPLGKIKKYRLKISVTEPENQSSIVQWQLQEWPGLKIEETIKDTTGYWLIKEKNEKHSLVLYHVYTDPGPIPFGLGWIVDVLSKNSVPEALLQTRFRTEKLAHTIQK